MGLSGVRRGAASPVVTYDFMDAGTFQSRPLFGGGGGGGRRREPGLPEIVSMETHHFH